MHGRHRGVPGRAVLGCGRPEGHRVEARRDDHRAARDEGRHRRGHQPVDVEKRHDAHRRVFGRQAIRARDVLGRERQVALPQRHELGPARRPTRVQHEGYVVAVRHLGGARRLAASAALQDDPTLSVEARLDQQRSMRQRASRRFSGARRNDEGSGGGVLEVELELVLFICRVEWRGRARRGRGQEKHDRLDAVRQHEGDPVVAAQAKPGETVGGGRHLFAKLRVGEPRAAGHDDRGRLRVAAPKRFIEGLHQTAGGRRMPIRRAHSRMSSRISFWISTCSLLAPQRVPKNLPAAVKTG